MKTKRELKNAYRQAKTQMGVFQIRNKANGKVFIDSSLDIVAKQNRHKAELKYGKHRNKDLQKDWKMLGSENFVFEVVSELEPKEEDINYTREVKDLQEMIIEDLHLSNDMKYFK